MDDHVVTEFFTTHLHRPPVMVILRGHDVARTVELCHRAWDLGVQLVEIPVQDATAFEALTAAARAAQERGTLVGAGTVVTPDLVRRSVDAGASFTVAPALDHEVAAASHRAGLPHLPGVATPGDVHQALRTGLSWLKAFPAAQLGVGWADAMHGPFPGARFVATGGVSPANAEEHLDAGAAAVSLSAAIGDDAQLPILRALIDRLRDRP